MKQKNEMIESMPRALTPIFSVAIIICSLFLMKTNLVVALFILSASVIILLERHTGIFQEYAR